MKNNLFIWLLCGFFAAPLFGGEEFILSYKLTTEDSIILNENFSLSKSMTQNDDTNFITEWCEILPTESDADSLYTILDKYRDELLECMFEKGVLIKSYGTGQNYVSNDISMIKIPPTRLYVEFKEQFVMIGIIKEQSMQLRDSE